jgi:hypothetical protein
MNLLEIFKTGTWTDMSGQVLSFSAEDLAATAEAYDPAVFKAPLVVGHPKLEDPAYGWVASLTSDQGKLLAGHEDVEPAFAEMVNAKRFPKVSASFYAPQSAANPKPGVWYLRHVGFLGAAAPAIPGLKAASFAGDAQGVVTIEFAGSDPAVTLNPESIPVKTTEQQTADFAAQQAALASKETDLATREKALADKEATTRKTEIAAFAEQLVSAGKVLPREQEGLVAFMAGLSDSDTVSFAAEGVQVSKPTGTWLREFLNGLPERVDFAERSAAEQNDEQTIASFAAPTGYSVDKDRLALHGKIVAHQQKHKVDYATAAAAVGG